MAKSGVQIARVVSNVIGEMEKRSIQFASLGLQSPHQLDSFKKMLGEFSELLFRKIRNELLKNMVIKPCVCRIDSEKLGIEDPEKILKLITECEQCKGTGYRNIMNVEFEDSTEETVQ